MDYPEDKTYRKQVVRLTELVEIDGLLEGFVFEGCQINGPAVLALMASTMIHNNLGGPDADALFWEVTPARPRVVGVVMARGCTFEDCTFANIGFAGPADLRKQLLGE